MAFFANLDFREFAFLFYSRYYDTRPGREQMDVFLTPSFALLISNFNFQPVMPMIHFLLISDYRPSQFKTSCGICPFKKEMYSRP